MSMMSRRESRRQHCRQVARCGCVTGHLVCTDRRHQVVRRSVETGRTACTDYRNQNVPV